MMLKHNMSTKTDTITRLKLRGVLTKDHVFKAMSFRRNANYYKKVLPKSIYLFLGAIILQDEPLETIEKTLKLPARSAKAILAAYLDVMDEIIVIEPKPPEGLASKTEQSRIQELEDTVEYLTGQWHLSEYIDEMLKYDLTYGQGQFWHILRSNMDRVVTYESIMRRLYHNRPESEWAGDKIVSVMVYHIRKKTTKVGCSYHILTLWGQGLLMTEFPEKYTRG